INDLLSFSRITTKAKRFVDVNLNHVLNEVLEDLEISIEDSQARISHEPLPVIHGDFLQIKQLFQNLIGNAIKFRAPDRIPEINITVDFDAGSLHSPWHRSDSGEEAQHNDTDDP